MELQVPKLLFFSRTLSYLIIALLTLGEFVHDLHIQVYKVSSDAVNVKRVKPPISRSAPTGGV